MEKKVSPMRSGEKRYEPPQLVLHGDIAEITKEDGFDFVDMPIGTPINDDVAQSNAMKCTGCVRVQLTLAD